jgi:chromate transport protein ChrA
MEENEKLKERAERLYLQGLLHAFAGAGNSADTESRKRAAGLWREAQKLYNKAGDKIRAKELSQSLAILYKKEYLKSRSKRKCSIVGKFEDWLMFLKIGCFGFGGPMAVFSLLQDELVREKQILTDKDFLEGAVLGDVLPGPVTMDIVTYTGYKLKKWYGALISTIAFILPSFVLMIILAMLKLTKAEMKDYRELCILIWAFASSLIFKLDIVIIVGLCGLVSIVIYNDEFKKTDAK